MDSLNALSRWDAKRAAVFEKLTKQQQKISQLPQRNKVKLHLRPGEVLREDFGSWVGALTPDAGAVNDFRTKMYRSDLRGLENSIVTNNRKQHPGWALWSPRTYQQPAQEDFSMMNMDGAASREIIRSMTTKILEPRAAPGIEPFFINTVNEAPLRGGSGGAMSGGALTQLDRNNRITADVSERYRELARQQARQATEMRRGVPPTPAQPQVLTALDEAKLQIGTTLETTAQQILRGVYSTDILRDLTTLSTAIARNAPLMDAGALGELLRYMNDLLSAMRANAKNTGKEIAEDNLLEFSDEPEDFGQSFRSFLAGRERAPQAEARDLDKGVKQAEGLAESIYARVEALADFVRQQFAVAERPMAERIQVARSALSTLGTNINRKSYPAELKKALEKEEEQTRAQEQEQAARDTAAAAQMRGELPELFVQDMPAAAPFAPEVMRPPADDRLGPLFQAMDEDAAARERAIVAQEEQLLADQAGRDAFDREIARLFEAAREAFVDEDFASEEAILRQALEVALTSGDQRFIQNVRQALLFRGFEPPATAAEAEELATFQAQQAARAAPAGATAAAPKMEAPVASAREEMLARQRAALEDARPAAAAEVTHFLGIRFPEARRNQLETDLADLGLDPSEPMDGNTEIPRDGALIGNINDFLASQGTRKINTGKGSIKLKDLFAQLYQTEESAKTKRRLLIGPEAIPITDYYELA